MTTLVELEKHLKIVGELLTNAKHLANDSISLVVTDSVTFTVIERHKFLRRLNDLHYAMAVIELTKLFSGGKHDDYCLRNLLKQLKKNHSKSEWSNKISIVEIENLENACKGELVSRKIEDLIIRRSNYYAHTSKKPPKKELWTYYEDLMDLIITGEGIVNELSTKILNKPVKFPKYEGENVKEFFKEYLEIITLAGLYNLHHRKE